MTANANEADRRLTPAPVSNPYAREAATSQAAVGSGRVGSELREACLARGWRQVVEAGSPKHYLVSAPDSRSDGGARRVQPLQRLPDAEGRVRSCAGAREERYGGRWTRTASSSPARPALAPHSGIAAVGAFVTGAMRCDRGLGRRLSGLVHAASGARDWATATVGATPGSRVLPHERRGHVQSQRPD